MPGTGGLNSILSSNQILHRLSETTDVKALVFSDTHGNVQFVTRMVKKVTPHVCLHLGDGLEDILEVKNSLKTPIVCVPGNCDFWQDPQWWKVVDLNGRRVFLTHGDRFQVDEGLDNLLAFAMKQKCDLVLYGHTHRPYVEWHGEVLVVNSGSAMLGSNILTCALVTIGAEYVNVEILREPNPYLVDVSWGE